MVEVVLDHGGSAGIAPVPLHDQLVTARPKLIQNWSWDTPLNLERQRLMAVIIKGAVHRQGIKARRLDRFLGVHPEFQHVQKYLKQRLILSISAWCGKGKPGLVVSERYRRS